MKRPYVLLAAAGLAAAVATAMPAGAATTHPAASTASGGYAVQQVNPTTYTNVLSKALSKEPLEGSWIIKTRSGSAVREVTAQGQGIEMQLQETGFSTFNASNPTNSNGTIYTTPNGLCVHGTTSTQVTGSTSCGASNTASQWDPDGTGRLINVAYGGYLGANANAEGENVRLEPESGAFYLTPFKIG